MRLTIRWLSIVFFLSGLSALIFQVVWQRALTLYYGAGPISIALIVSIYMAGLGFGALIGGNLAERIVRRIEIYAAIEFLVGCFGLISLHFMDFIGRHTAGSPYLLSSLCMIAFLLIPTLLMGVTLPLLTKIFNSYLDDFSTTVSSLYFINTLGAAFGSLFASYVLISFWGLDVAVYVACTVNFFLAIIVVVLLRYSSRSPAQQQPQSHVQDESLGRWVYLLVFITGFLAIGYEIIWFRVIGVLVKGSAYVFPTALAVYLTGIALGSLWMGRWLYNHPQSDKKNLFFLIQASIGLIVAVIFIKYYYLTKLTPFGELTRYSFRIHDHPMMLSWNEEYVKGVSFGVRLYLLLDIFWWSFFFVLIPTLLMGASFPLIARLALRQKDKEGWTIGHVYFFNVMGNVLGGAVTAFILLEYLGTEITLVIFTIIGLFFGLRVRRLGSWGLPVGVRICTVGILVGVVIRFFPIEGNLYRLIHSKYEKEFWNAYFEEGRDAVVLTYHTNAGTTNFISGTTQGGRPAYSFYAQVIEGMSYVPHLQKALVLGYGTGGVVEAILKSDTVEKVTIVELSRTLMENLQKIRLFKDMLANPKVDLKINGARRFLLGSHEKYDLIVSFLVRSTTAYSNNIYSMEFFNLIKRHLNPGGVFLLWVHDTTIISRTIATVFPYVSLYRCVDNISAIASETPLKQDSVIVKRTFSQFAPEEREPIIQSYPQILANRDMIMIRTEGFPVNTDLKPYSEYYIGEYVRNRPVINK